MANETIELKLDDKFEDAFPDKLIPSNCYLDKSKTGLGMTYAEFHADRHSIIVIPYTSVIELKVKEYKYKMPLKIINEVTIEDVKKYLENDVEFKKIVTTPEGFKKIIDAANSINKIDWLYTQFFCLLDEAHCYAVDAFRKYILMPFDYFWEFTNKALGTATYFPYSDPRFSQLKLIKIKYDEPFGKITIINHSDPKTVLHDFLINPDQFPGNVHIFYNSVKEMEKVVRLAGISDLNIYCREEDRNLKKLGELAAHFRHEPNAADYKKFNFYSARYYDGWDLFDNDTATIILVTDIKVPHSLVGIPYNAFQAVGRLRKVTPHNIYHVTNNFVKTAIEVRSFDHISKNWYYQAFNHTEYYNNFKAKCKKDGMEEKQETWRLANRHCKFDFITTNATVYPMKVDQHICEEYSNEGYANIDTIQQQWKNMNYEVQVVQNDLDKLITKGESKAVINRRVIAMIEEFRDHPDKYLYTKANTTITTLKDSYGDLFSFYTLFGKQKLEEIKYCENDIKRALAKFSNDNHNVLLKQMVLEAFKPDVPYTNQQIKQMLDDIYHEIGIVNADGKRKKPTATDLEELNLFVINKTTRAVNSGIINPKTGKLRRVPVWIFHLKENDM
jgi:hypothetical protein